MVDSLAAHLPLVSTEVGCQHFSLTCPSRFDWRALVQCRAVDQAGRWARLRQSGLHPTLSLLDLRSSFNLRAEDLNTLLRHPAAPLHRLTTLYAGEQVLSSGNAQLLSTHCRLLRSLHAGMPDSESPAVFIRHILDRFPALTDFGLESDHNRCYRVNADAVVPLTDTARPPLQLTRLSLRRLLGGAWQPLLTSLSLQSLRELSAEGVADWLYHGTPPIDWSACWTNLHSLQLLSLKDCAGIDLLLAPLVAHAPDSLRVLSLSALVDALFSAPVEMGDVSSASLGPLVPSALLIKRILEQRPLLRTLSMRIESQAAHVSLAARYSQTREQAAERWQTVQIRYADLQSRFPLRMHLLCTGAPPAADAALSLAVAL